MKKRNHKPEPLQPGQFYHIFNRGNNSIDIFFDTDSYYHFLRLYTRYLYPVTDTYAWCLLKNHFHLLVYIRKPEEIEEHLLEYSTVDKPKVLSATHQFSHFFNAYTQAINKKFRRTGCLFEKPFGRRWIHSTAYLRNVICYIHQNPVIHGFAKRPEDYPWTSFEVAISERPTQLRREEVMQLFAGKNQFISFHREPFNFSTIHKFIVK